MNTILAIWNKSNTGKTSTIRNFANQLLNSGAEIFTGSIQPNSDFTVILNIRNIRIGITSEGDPGSNLENRLISLVNQNCQIIICATRTRGETVVAVENTANNNDYATIWTSTYQGGGFDHQLLNTLKSNHLFDLLINTGLLGTI